MDINCINIMLNNDTNNQLSLNGPRREKICLRGFTNNKGADKHAHPRRLISAFLFDYLHIIVSIFSLDILAAE